MRCSISNSSSVSTPNASVTISGNEVQPSPPPPSDSITGLPFTVLASKAEDIMKNPYHHHHHHLDSPPLDDCCPICFGDFSVPCKSNCGHWYCGSCILRYWSYSTVTKPCKCPMCTSSIIKLTPEASLHDQEEDDVIRVLGNVREYNSLFVGGLRGLVQKVRRSPLFIKRVFLRLMDPDTPAADFFLLETGMRYVALILSVIYMAYSFNFIPTGGLGVQRLFDYATTILVLLLRLVGIYRRHRLRRHVRQLAVAQPLLE